MRMRRNGKMPSITAYFPLLTRLNVVDAALAFALCFRCFAPIICKSSLYAYKWISHPGIVPLTMLFSYMCTSISLFVLVAQCFALWTALVYSLLCRILFNRLNFNVISGSHLLLRFSTGNSGMFAQLCFVTNKKYVYSNVFKCSADFRDPFMSDP